MKLTKLQLLRIKAERLSGIDEIQKEIDSFCDFTKEQIVAEELHLLLCRHPNGHSAKGGCGWLSTGWDCAKLGAERKRYLKMAKELFEEEDFGSLMKMLYILIDGR
jgi:hypothetical protein